MPAGPQVRLFAVRPEGTDAGVFDDRRVWPVLGCWPGGSPTPRVEHCTLGELLAQHAAGGRMRGVGLIELDGSEPAERAHGLADVLGVSGMPAVVLAPEEMMSAVEFLCEEGAVVLASSAGPEAVASALATLAARQPMVDRLGRELHVAQAALRSAAQQMSAWQEEMELAAQIQRELMPSDTPRIDGVDVGVVFRPAGYVSGDVFDVRRVGSRSVAFFVADAVGHGVPAALMTLLVARTLRSLDSSEALDPEAALTRLNCELCAQQTGRQRFVTAVYGVLDTQSGRLRISGAGHPPPILAGVRGVERIETDGPLLGVFDGAEFPAVELELGADDVLILFSDGFETAFPDPGAQGRRLKLPTRRYVEHLVGCRSDGSTLAEAAERLEQDLDSQAGSLHQPDDVTAVLLSPARAATPTSAALAA